jgi:hypothetical protein
MPITYARAEIFGIAVPGSWAAAVLRIEIDWDWIALSKTYCARQKNSRPRIFLSRPSSLEVLGMPPMVLRFELDASPELFLETFDLLGQHAGDAILDEIDPA